VDNFLDSSTGLAERGWAESAAAASEQSQ
jgi:hypothetical protein